MDNDALIFDLAPRGDDKVTSALSRVMDTLSRTKAMGSVALDVLNKVFDRPSKGGSGGGPSGPGGPKGGGGGGAVATGTSIAAALVNPMAMLMKAMDAVANKFTSVTSSVLGFVQAASPAATERLTQSLQDLMATIGEKLTPIIEVASALVERFANVVAGMNIDALVDKLAEMFAKLGGAFIDLVTAIWPAVSAMIDAFMPALDAVSQVFTELRPTIMQLGESFATLMDALAPLREAIVDGFVWVLKEVLVPALQFVGNVIQNVADFIYKAIYTIAAILKNPTKIFKVGEVWNEAERQLEQRRAARAAQQAAMNAAQRNSATSGISINSIESVSSRALQAAGKAGATAQRNYMEEIANNTLGTVGGIVQLGAAQAAALAAREAERRANELAAARNNNQPGNR